MSSEALMSETKKWDLLGIALSFVCAVHCLSVPLLLGAAPLAGLEIVANHEFEWVMMSLIFGVAAFTYFSGFRRHGRKEVFLFLAVGVVVFLLVRPLIPEAWHPVATLSGGMVFVTGHWKNWRWHRPSCGEPCCSGR